MTLAVSVEQLLYSSEAVEARPSEISKRVPPHNLASQIGNDERLTDVTMTFVCHGRGEEWGIAPLPKVVTRPTESELSVQVNLAEFLGTRNASGGGQ